MQKRIVMCVFFLFCAFFFRSHSSEAQGSEECQITAKEAFDLLEDNQAILIDVRTKEEYTYVGSPALEPGGEPIAYLIPWYTFKGHDQNGKILYEKNPDFDNLINRLFGDNKDQRLILICASGIRSSFALQRLKSLGFPHVQEIDNYLKEEENNPDGGGRGGFQGSRYENEFNGYKGYPGRISHESGMGSKLALYSEDIEDKEDSVSWMDTGLPVTHRIDPDKIPHREKTEQSEKSSNGSSYTSFVNYPITPYSYQQNQFFQTPFLGTSFQSQNFYFPSTIMNSMNLVFPQFSYYPNFSSSFSSYGIYPGSTKPSMPLGYDGG